MAGLFAAVIFAAGPLAAQDAGDLFSKLDANKDGYVTPDEVPEPQRALYERLLRNADKDGDKKLSKEEFQAGLKPDETPKPPLAGGPGGPGGPRGGKGDPREFFSRMDANKDGKLSKDELPEQMRENFARMDANGDGSISQEEFAQAGRQFGKRPPTAPPALLSPDQLEAKFAEADKNKDGKITKDEMRDESERATLGRFAEQLNPGGDGSLTKEQYIRVMSRALGIEAPPPAAGRPNPGPAPNREQIEALFDRTDSNSDGKLTKDEIPEERQGMRVLLERSGGDSLSKEQFVRGLLAMPQPFVRGMLGMPQIGGPPGRPEGTPQRPPQGSPGAPPGGGLFAALDTDRNGELSTTEIVAAGTALLKLDRNGDGKLTPDEAFGPGGPGGGPPGRPGVGQPGNGLPPGAPPGQGRPGQRGLGGLNPEEFRQRLKEADANNDGKISKEEAPPLLKDRFDRVDANSDGFVDESEVREMLRRMADGAGKMKGRPGGDQPRRPDPNNDKT
jgi:Ca2+-binding EF-hand superfamily protein